MGRIKEVEYGELKSFGMYNNLKISFKAEVNEGEDYNEVLKSLAFQVKSHLDSDFKDISEIVVNLRQEKAKLETDIMALSRTKEILK